MKTHQKIIIGGLGALTPVIMNLLVVDINGENIYYAVVIGANLTHEEAQKLRQQALLAGFSEDTYLWTFPK